MEDEASGLKALLDCRYWSLRIPKTRAEMLSTHHRRIGGRTETSGRSFPHEVNSVEDVYLHVLSGWLAESEGGRR